MLRSIIISPDRVLASQLHAAIVQSGSAAVERTIDRYPDAVDLSRTMRASAPQIVFVGTTSVEHVIAISEFLEKTVPGIQVIAAGEASNPETLMALMRGGIREMVTSPFDP